jgi:hypothetical protein
MVETESTAKAVETETPKPASGKKCEECGEDLGKSKSKICMKCLGKRSRGHPKPARRKQVQEPAETKEDIYEEDAVYYCDCGAKLRYLQRRCPKCKAWNDWRNTPAESDPQAIICPECGSYVGDLDEGLEICPHCHFGG